VLKNTFAGFVVAVEDDADAVTEFEVFLGAVGALDAIACLLGMSMPASSQELGSRLFAGEHQSRR